MHAHLNELLQHNDSPSTAVCAEVKALISKPLAELEHKDVEIQNLLLALGYLEAEHDVLDKIMDEYSPILSPIRRIPSEILQEIFYYCLPEHRNPVMSVEEAPLLFTFICRSWRSIVISCPRIWARLHIPLILYSPLSIHLAPFWQPVSPAVADEQQREAEERYRKTMIGRRQSLERCLSLSGACPLSISISFQGDATHPINTGALGSENDLVRIFDLIFSVSSRLQDLELAMPFEMYQILEHRIPINSLSILRSLRLSFLSPLITPHPSPPKKQVILLQAPTLRSLSTAFDSVHILDPQIVPSTWANLTNLSSHSPITNMDAIQLLCRCRCLIRCKLVISNEWHDAIEHDPGQIISLHSLRFLSLCFYGRDSMSGLYQWLDAPSLYWFDYQPHDHFSYANPITVDDPSSLPISPARMLIERSTALKKLSFHPQMLSRQDIVFCFQWASQLTHLILGQSPRCRTFPLDFAVWAVNANNFDLNLLILQGDLESDLTSEKVPLLPKLEIFEAYLNPNRFSDQTVKKFILGRLGHSAARKGVSSLRSVTIPFAREMETEISEEIYRTAEIENVEIKLDLQYYGRKGDYNEKFSPWYGLSEVSNYEGFSRF